MVPRVCISSAIAATLLLHIACAPTHTIKLQRESQSGPFMGAGAEKQISIVGYTTRDGVHREFSGTVACEENLCTFRPPHGNTRPFTLSCDAIESFDVIGSTKGGRAVAAALVVATVVVAIYFISIGERASSGLN